MLSFRHIFAVLFIVTGINTGFAQDQFLAANDVLSFSPAASTPLVSLDKDVYRPGSVAMLQLNLASLFDAYTEACSAKVYLSRDASFDFGDDLLETYWFDQPCACRLELPFAPDTATGNYYLVAVAQTEAGVLMSKVCYVPVSVK